jgi:hypothetical protein
MMGLDSPFIKGGLVRTIDLWRCQKSYVSAAPSAACPNGT